jgi:Glycosyl hydrolase catalytic core
MSASTRTVAGQAPAMRVVSSAVGLVAVVAVTLLMLALAGPAAANQHQFRYGVVEGNPLQPDTDIPGMGAANVEVLRVLINWSRVEDQRGARGQCNAVYDWSYYDSVVTEAGRAGVRLAPFILGSPGYVGPLETSAPPTKSRAIEDYKCFLRALVERYGRGGDVPTFDPRSRPITEWQVWNEPNLREYSAKNKPDPREYARLLKISQRVIQNVDPQAQIILAGMPEIPGRGIYVHKYLKRLYKVRGIERTFDAVALHPYARNWRGLEGALIRLRRTLQQVRDARRTVWVTEFGWSDLGPDEAFQVKGPKGQATQLTKSVKLMRRKRGRYNLGTITWFRWRDTATRQQNGERFEYAGLYRKNGEPKRACRAFVKFTKGNCPQVDVGTGTARADDLLEPTGAAVEPSPSPPE